MKIIFDGRWLGRTGIGRYSQELLDQLQELDRDNEYIVLLLPEWHAKWEPKAPNFRAELTTYEVYTWQEQVLLPRQIAALEPDLVHFTSFNAPAFYRGAFVVTIHDLTLVNFKNVRGEGLKRLLYEAKYAAMKFVLKSAAKHSRRIITPTEFVKKNLELFYAVATGKTSSTWLAASERFAKPGNISRFGLQSGFILYVGNYYPYKNVGVLIEAFARSKARHNGHKLVLNGKPEHFQDMIKSQVERLDLHDSVVFPGFTTDEELAGLYRDAGLFVFPSLSEGFGLPGLEAMAQGTPVLAARASCLPEVYGEAAEYFDPMDTEDLIRQIDWLLNDPKKREQLSRLGFDRLKQFSWQRMAQQTLEIYDTAARKQR